MSLLKRGRKRVSVTAFAVTLVGYMALSVIGAAPASAVSTCSFAGGVATVSAPDDGDTVKVYQDENGGIHVAGEVAGAEPAVDGSDDLAGCTGVQFGVATTTTINITGATGNGAFDQDFYVELAGVTSGVGYNDTAVSWGTINWTVNGGNNTAAGDSLLVVGNGDSDGADDPIMNVTGGANGIDLNTDGDLDLTFANIENFTFSSFDDTDGQNIDLRGSTATGGPFAFDATIDEDNHGIDNTFYGGDGDDTMLNDGDDDIFGPGLGSDNVTCDSTVSTLDYSNTAVAINANLSINTVTQGTDLDTVIGCDNVIGTGQADTITGDGGDNVITPGAGNDTVAGGLGDDMVDYSDATEGVVVDLGAGTATGGSGSDTLSGIEDVNGTDANDDLTGDANDNELFGNRGNDSLSGGAGDGDGDDSFDGGSGIDTVDYGANTLPTFVDLDNGAFSNGVSTEDDFIEPDTIENAILGTGDDSFAGSEFNNIVFPGGGQNSLDGENGIDTLKYNTDVYDGVTINLAGGGATGGGSDSIMNFENAAGSAGDDTIIGTDIVAGGGTGANLLIGGKGNDNVSGNAGPDLIKGGGGSDKLRGGNGDDDMLGGPGKDNLRGGGGADNLSGGGGKDTCFGEGGKDTLKGCEKGEKKNTKSRIARLVRMG